jgi:L-rhamnose-H+ transport protein
MVNIWAGFALFLVSAIFNGVVALPLRLRRRFEVENTWTSGNLFAMIIFPLIAAPLILPTWKSALGAAGLGALTKLVAFGFGWGTGSVAYSLGVAAIGLGVGIATIMGIVVAVGAGIPLLRRWGEIPPGARPIALAGIIIAIVGVAVVGWAGMQRERTDVKSGVSRRSVQADLAPRTDTPRRTYIIGLCWCIFSGVASACANIGFDFAGPLGKAAVALGANPVFASFFRWMPLFAGGYLAILVFSGSTLVRRQSWRNFFGPGAGRDFGLAIFLGISMFGALITYGMGAVYLGELGTSVGYAVATTMGLIIANLMGFVTGEWKGAARGSLKTLCVGLGILILAIVLLAVSNSSLA